MAVLILNPLNADWMQQVGFSESDLGNSYMVLMVWSNGLNDSICERKESMTSLLVHGGA